MIQRSRVRVPAGAAGEFLLQGQLFLLTLTSVSFRYHVFAVACKRSRSFCPKCRWQVTAKHTCTIDNNYVVSKGHHNVMHGCMVYTERSPIHTRFTWLHVTAE